VSDSLTFTSAVKSRRWKNTNLTVLRCICQIIIVSIYVPSTHAYAHVFMSVQIFVTRQGNTTTIEAIYLYSI
jgi:hypothetical protein